jgi:hypothetical protein
MDGGPHNLPERSTVTVEMSPLLCGFIGKFHRIIAQTGVLWPKTFCVIAEWLTDSSGDCTADDRQLAFSRPPKITI